jgi:hypothetical protein
MDARGIAAAARVPVGNELSIDGRRAAVNDSGGPNCVVVSRARGVCWRSGTGRGTHRVEASLPRPFFVATRQARVPRSVTATCAIDERK